MLRAAEAAERLGLSATAQDDDAPLTPEQSAEVDAYINSRENRAWERRVALTMRKALGLPSPLEAYLAILAERQAALRHVIAGRRRAAKMQRTPPWADREKIKAVYLEARALTKLTGVEHHVDHVIPLQGKLVSGLHVHQNLQVLVASQNCRKGNRFDVP